MARGRSAASDADLYFLSMKRLPRDPIRFDLANAFAEFGRLESVSLRDPAATDGFVDRIRESVRRSLSNEALLHGLRTQAMFEALSGSFFLDSFQNVRDPESPSRRAAEIQGPGHSEMRRG